MDFIQFLKKKVGKYYLNVDIIIWTLKNKFKMLKKTFFSGCSRIKMLFNFWFVITIANICQTTSGYWNYRRKFVLAKLGIAARVSDIIFQNLLFPDKNKQTFVQGCRCKCSPNFICNARLFRLNYFTPPAQNSFNL